MYRAIVAFAFNILWLNVNLKKEMCTSVKKEMVGQLVTKVIHGNIQQFMIYSGVLYWPLTTLAAARLSAPFFVLILAYICLRELATRAQLIYLAFTLTGAAAMILNSP